MAHHATVVAGVALFVALGGSAAAADHLVGTNDMATSAVTSAKIRNGTVQLKDLSTRTRASLRGATGATGSPGSAGIAGVHGLNGPNGANGSDGRVGSTGAAGTNGTNGTDGTNGTNGADGILSPLSVAVTTTAIPTSASRTVVATLAVPAGNYVVLAKTQLSHTGAGDTVDCFLKAGSTEIDQVSMKTMPALAAVPAALEAVTTTSPTQLSLECKVLTANGSADFTKLIALPIG